MEADYLMLQLISNTYLLITQVIKSLEYGDLSGCHGMHINVKIIHIEFLKEKHLYDIFLVEFLLKGPY